MQPLTSTTHTLSANRAAILEHYDKMGLVKTVDSGRAANIVFADVEKLMF